MELRPASGHPGPVNVGNPHELSVLQIARDVIAATGSASTIEFVGRPVDDPMVRRPDTTLATEVLGWAPEVAWEDGLARTVAWFRDAVDVETAPDGVGADDAGETVDAVEVVG